MSQRRWNTSYPMTRERRVVITGLGAISAAGVGAAILWEKLLAGQSAISYITRYEAGDMSSRIGGEVKDFDPVKLIDPRLKPKRLSRQGQFAAVATREAVDHAGLDNQVLRRRKCGVVLGSANCNVEEISTAAIRVENRGSTQISPSSMALMSMQGQVTTLVDMLELQNVPAFSIAGACTSGIDAVATAVEMIQSGQTDTMICGGTDAPLSRTAASALIQAGICSNRNDAPELASRPFDRERDNGLLGEGAGIVVLERLDQARERGATIYAEWLGDHASRDPDGSDPGSGLNMTMVSAMHNARCQASEIDYISAWGCGDPMIDRLETAAIKQVFGARAYDLAVSSVKGVTGNPLGAAGALQLVAAALSFHHGLLPPTANYEHGDLDCDLDYIQGQPRRIRPRRIMLNAHGQGGGNTSVVLGPAPKE